MAAAIEIYTRPGCGYCSAAISLLQRKKAAFTHFDTADRSEAAPGNVRPYLYPGATFPQIFIDGTPDRRL